VRVRVCRDFCINFCVSVFLLGVKLEIKWCIEKWLHQLKTNSKDSHLSTTCLVPFLVKYIVARMRDKGKTQLQSGAYAPSDRNTIHTEIARGPWQVATWQFFKISATLHSKIRWFTICWSLNFHERSKWNTVFFFAFLLFLWWSSASQGDPCGALQLFRWTESLFCGYHRYLSS
jgi:hypothetical protein